MAHTNSPENIRALCEQYVKNAASKGADRSRDQLAEHVRTLIKGQIPKIYPSMVVYRKPAFDYGLVVREPNARTLAIRIRRMQPRRTWFRREKEALLSQRNAHCAAGEDFAVIYLVNQREQKDWEGNWPNILAECGVDAFYLDGTPLATHYSEVQEPKVLTDVRRCLAAADPYSGLFFGGVLRYADRDFIRFLVAVGLEAITSSPKGEITEATSRVNTKRAADIADVPYSSFMLDAPMARDLQILSVARGRGTDLHWPKVKGFYSVLFGEDLAVVREKVHETLLNKGEFIVEEKWPYVKKAMTEHKATRQKVVDQLWTPGLEKQMQDELLVVCPSLAEMPFLMRSLIAEAKTRLDSEEEVPLFSVRQYRELAELELKLQKVRC